MLQPPFAPDTPESPSPRKKLPSFRQISRILALTLVAVMLIGALQVVRGATNTQGLASGPAATATITVTDTGTAGTTTSDLTPGLTPAPTAASGGNPGTQTGTVRVTQNQDMRPACLGNSTPYTVLLYNAGTVAANWHVNIPEFIGLAPGKPIAGMQPLSSPLSTTPYWANVNPQDGSVAPGQTASFVMSPVWAIPCDGTSYKAAVQLRFPSGTAQADIPLTYAGTGPAPYSNVVLVSGTPNMTQLCPASGAAPAPFTFAIKNIGNAIAVPVVDNTKETIGINPWATGQITADPQEPVSSWLYAGQTWTVTITPRVGVSCGGAVYHIYVDINNTQGTSQTLTFTVTFN
jgi:hypothetical protein